MRDATKREYYQPSVYEHKPTSIPSQPLEQTFTDQYFESHGIDVAVAMRYPHLTGPFCYDTNETIPSLGWVYQDGEVDGSEGILGIRWQAMGQLQYESRGVINTLYGVELVPPDTTTLVITQRELDVLALATVGHAAVSIPYNNTSSKPAPIRPEDDYVFAFLWENKDLIEQCDKIVLVFHENPVGEATVQEIARRIGRAKCYTRYISPGYSYLCDEALANDVSIKGLIDEAEPMPLTGIYEASQFREAFEELWEQGVGKGESTGMTEVDELFTIAPLLYIVTGVPGSGKSEFTDQITMNLSMRSGWRHAVCSFENPPHMHISKLTEKYIGKPFFHGMFDRVSEYERDQAFEFIDRHFMFFDQMDETPSTIDSILERARDAVLRMGVKTLCIDPYNFIETNGSEMSETKEISELLSKVTRFSRAHECAVFLIAHPAKLYPDHEGVYPVPTGYSISGSAHWFNKADIGFTVHRGAMGVEIHTWKIRFKWLGKLGMRLIGYDLPTGRYYDKKASAAPLLDPDLNRDQLRNPVLNLPDAFKVKEPEPDPEWWDT